MVTYIIIKKSIRRPNYSDIYFLFFRLQFLCRLIIIKHIVSFFICVLSIESAAYLLFFKINTSRANIRFLILQINSAIYFSNPVLSPINILLNVYFKDSCSFCQSSQASKTWFSSVREINTLVRSSKIVITITSWNNPSNFLRINCSFKKTSVFCLAAYLLLVVAWCFVIISHNHKFFHRIGCEYKICLSIGNDFLFFFLKPSNSLFIHTRFAFLVPIALIPTLAIHYPYVKCEFLYVSVHHWNSLCVLAKLHIGIESSTLTKILFSNNIFLLQHILSCHNIPWHILASSWHPRYA